MNNASTHPGILLLVRFKSSLPAEELKKRYSERMPLFRDLPGLLQKYYVYDSATEEWGGFYQPGHTCCGREERCGAPSCSAEETCRHEL